MVKGLGGNGEHFFGGSGRFAPKNAVRLAKKALRAICEALGRFKGAVLELEKVADGAGAGVRGAENALPTWEEALRSF